MMHSAIRHTAYLMCTLHISMKSVNFVVLLFSDEQNGQRARMLEYMYIFCAEPQLFFVVYASLRVYILVYTNNRYTMLTHYISIYR